MRTAVSKPPASNRQLQNGFLWASACGHDDIAEFLLDCGADPTDPADTGATALHWAAGAADVGLVKLLIDRGAPLEIRNRWGGTVLEHAGHGFKHGPADLDFVQTFETLLAAGAQIRGSWLKWLEDVNSRSIEEKQRLAEVLRRYGATE
jgi:ankyrin repeat protein